MADLAVRDGDVHELDEPRRGGHPGEHPFQRIAVGRGDVVQVAARGEATEHLLFSRVEECEANDEPQREDEPRADTAGCNSFEIPR